MKNIPKNNFRNLQSLCGNMFAIISGIILTFIIWQVYQSIISINTYTSNNQATGTEKGADKGKRYFVVIGGGIWYTFNVVGSDKPNLV